MQYSSSSEPVPNNRRFIPGHCMYKPKLKAQMPNCPYGHVWRKGHYRRVPTVEETHKFMKHFYKRVWRNMARHPEVCANVLERPEFIDCLKLIKKGIQSFLLKNPTRSQLRKYADHVVDRVILCTGRRLQNTCYVDPTTKLRRHIEQRMSRYIDPYLEALQ